MIHWEHFSDVFMTSAVTGDGVDELRMIILLYIVYNIICTCCHSDDHHGDCLPGR